MTKSGAKDLPDAIDKLEEMMEIFKGKKVKG